MIALNPLAKALQAVYGVATTLNTFIDDQIESMKNSAKETVQVCGRVLEGAKFGFGIGYIVPTLILAAGQLLLGNPLGAAGTALTAATLTNPTAITCAAIGAIYYGWDALSDSERQEFLDRLSSLANTGKELIKSVLAFVVDFMRGALNSDTIKELKEFVSDAAKSFGKAFSDITRNIKDKVLDAADFVAEKVSDAADYVKTKGNRA